MSSDFASAGAVGRGTTVGYVVKAPAGLAITSAIASPGQTAGINDGQGWSAYMFRAGSIDPLRSYQESPYALNTDSGFASGYFGIAMRCGWQSCANPAEVNLNDIIITASEAQGPTVTPVGGAGNLWNQAGPGRWIWNPPGTDWPLEVASGDVTGVCALTAQVGASTLADPLPAPSDSSWQECAEPQTWTPAVDTRDSVTGAGTLPITIDATNAGQVTTPMSESVQVDNDPVSVSLSTPDDSNPTLWVNHPVTVDASANTGPSGLGGMTCSVDGGAAQSYRAGGLVVGGDGARTVSCTAWNNAVDPQGDHASASSSTTLHIDQTPPAVGFQAQSPSDPTGVVVDASDSESGVAGGSIEMAPAGTNDWTSLPTSLGGSQLAAHFDDAGRTGAYTFKAHSCDNVGNCASTTTTLTLPVRQGARSQVRLATTGTGCPTTKAAQNARARASSEHRARHARKARPRRRARPKSASLKIGPAPHGHPSASPAAEAPAAGSTTRPAPPRRPRAHRAARARRAGGAHRARAAARSHRAHHTAAAKARRATRRTDHRPARASRPRKSHRAGAARSSRRAPRSKCSPSVTLSGRGRVPYGSPVTVRGRLLDSQGQPLAGQIVSVLTAPDNGSNAFTQATAVSTAANGNWTASLAPGPSRIIKVSYPGSPTVLPASAQTTVTTPAKIKITRVTPDRTPWGSTVRISGRVLGGYIPTSSKLLRLDLGVVGIPGLSKIQGIPNVSPNGRFTTTYTFAHASGVVRFWLRVSSLAEADFPFAPARSRRVIVTVGVPAAASSHHSKHHHHRHRQQHRHQHMLARRGAAHHHHDASRRHHTRPRRRG